MKKIKVKRTSATIVLIIISIIICAAFCGMIAEAKTRVMVSGDRQGHLYINQNGKNMRGWFKLDGKLCYAYKTAHTGKPKGSLATNVFKVRNGKLYYLGNDGRQEKEESRYISYNRDGSVHIIYPAGRRTRRWERYNANHKRYQHLGEDGKWRDVGMQCWPEGQVDWEK